MAFPKFEAGQRYHIVCQQFTQGCVTDGASAGKNTPLYYQTVANQRDESAWIISVAYGNVVTIQNAKTGQYVTYDGQRQDSPQLLRYVCMTDETVDGYSYWYLELEDDGTYAIHNYGMWDHIWDVRVDSYCVGTYSNLGIPSQNQRFFFTEEDGTPLAELQPNASEDGFYVSSWLDATTESPDGWSVEGPSWGDPGFGDYEHYDEEGSLVSMVSSPFLERWQSQWSGGLSDGRIFQTIRHLPAGGYTVFVDVIAVLQGYNASDFGTPAEGVYFFANDQSVACSSGSERPEFYSLDVTVGDDGVLTLGLYNEHTTANWIAFDNVGLIYHGTEEEMIEGEKEKIRQELADYLSPSEIEALITQAGNNFYNLEAVRMSVANMTIDPLAKALQGLTIDGHAPVYVGSLDLYLCTIPLENFGSQLTARVDYTKREDCGTLKIGATTVEPGTDYRFSAVRAGRTYRFSVADKNGTTIEKNVTFTSLPVVRITGTFNDNYSDGTIVVHEPDKPVPETMQMKAKWRGGITNGGGKHKRNYHVKLQDAKGEKRETSFMGMRNDNSWILESCQVDMSRIRNRVLTDLWNDYCVKPYYFAEEKKAMTGTRGHFVELILNDDYRGIYCMTENMDRKQMKLKKIDEDTQEVHGQLWKSKDWSYGVFMGHDTDNRNYPRRHPSNYYEWSEMWENYQVKYPDFEDYGYTTDWETLYNAVDFVCTSTNANFKDQFSEYFDLPVVIDYYILMETILSTDNHGKNMFFAVYDKQVDKKITFGVWDMDATCGQRWSDEYFHKAFLGPEQDYAKFITNYEHGDYNLFKRLRDTNAENFNEQVRLRYYQLRQNQLATESILNRFRNYLDEFKTCGAAQREYDKWSYDSDVAGHKLDFDDEMEYLDDWFTRRMNYLDNTRFKIAELDAIHSINTTASEASSDVYDLRGLKVGTIDHFDRLPAGIYMVNGRKYSKTR